MKIRHKIEFLGKSYTHLSDNTKELDASTLFVSTPRNAQFIQEVKQNNQAILDFKELAKYFDIPSCIIGITGTNGKTTIANIIAHTLKKLGKKVGVIGTQGVFANDKTLKPKGLTTPGILELYENLSLLKQENCQIVAMEVSSHAIDQQRIYGLNFAARILSNITGDHLDYHGNLENYIRIKNSFLNDSGLKIINADEKNITTKPDNALYYGLDNDGLDLTAMSYDFKSNIKAVLKFNHCYTQDLSSKLYGKHNLYNLMAAILCIDALFGQTKQFSTYEIIQAASDFSGVAGRMEVVSAKPLIIIDFAHTHDGMEKIFESCKDLEIIALFGAGGDRDKTKRPLMGAMAEKYANKIFLTSDNPRSENPENIINDILAGISDVSKVHIQSNRAKSIQDAIEYQKNHAPNAVLLILGKGDETHQIIGDQKIDFDDRKVVKTLIEKL